MSEERKFQSTHTLRGEQILVPFFNRKSDGRKSVAAVFDHDEVISLVFHKNDLVEMYMLLDNAKNSELAKDLRRAMFCQQALESEDKEAEEV